MARRDRLIDDAGHLHLRYMRDGRRTFQHWARAYAWYMLGLTRALTELEQLPEELRPDDRTMADLRAECVRIAAVAMRHQRGDGLWSCFVDDHTVAPDTSGSAGIAAALAAGARAGLLPVDCGALASAERAFGALLEHLTPDGLLTGVSQSNRGGEALQRGDYRVISQMGMGLLAQLYAALR
ncbi:glycoside hydrolase family 88 protein [Paenibacillus sp. IB182496]|uniref:Glycoside hydrolase family 88 protein n=1 Tax=Paenibacillus sabuli TaxID=2772509 RepID=A0A927BYM7_9BACL|nr:glycoside hydrolase family 88 protein [Paenibacillus sabuli]MBD2847824.1 glycoside hydrolase family 88 protein [Paenibacillus sabuli]